ncbi:hypothetical protein BV25DRAFT_1839295 [Artomyces pyxidatus]|uniref:Uncharacterized protein n=1 Tax=Artomyces pyxidatus TaxID=48021 RepID=A0ACB8SWV6_9AGAM|nr:hypothetical protein BV25DRAFT_1839295 [Artomyces pyxidatus]
MASQANFTTSIGYASNAHRVLAIPELLTLVFSFGDRVNNATYSLVNKQWREIALDNIWREVDCLYYLFRILVPMSQSPTFGNVYAFTRSPTQQDWAHFMSYARRVRVLRHWGREIPPDRETEMPSLDDSAFQDIARTRTTLAVFPNLRSLSWMELDPRLNQAIFMHENIAQYAVLLDATTRGIDDFLVDITARMPALRDVTVACPPGLGDFAGQSVLQSLFRGVPMLRKIVLPKECLDGHVLKELSALPELEVIEFDTLGGIKCDNPVIDVTLDDGAFPSLWDLCLNSYVGLQDMRRFLVGGALLPRLTSLFVESLNPELASTVHDFLNGIVTSYPNLEVFAMDIVMDTDAEVKDHSITMEHVRPLLTLKKLKSLELRHSLPLKLTPDDFAELASAFPLLENLVLNPEPLDLIKPSLDLEALITLAQHCPQLHTVGIYVDAETAGEIVLRHKTTPRLPLLRTLNFGVSPIGADQVPIALFLSHVVSEEVTVCLESGVTWSAELYAGSPTDYSGKVADRCDAWAEVAKMVPLLMQLKKQEKDERREIQREVEDLRMRNELLMEKAKIPPTGGDYGNGCLVC